MAAKAELMLDILDDLEVITGTQTYFLAGKWQNRKTLAEKFCPVCANEVRIQYGGSMKPGNAKELMAMEEIDGGLIGGASLKAPDFATIVAAAK